MATSLPKSKQWKLGQLALLPYDVDVANNLSVAGSTSFAGALTATGGIRLKVNFIDAAGSTVSDATALGEGFNVVAAANDTKGVKLPTAPTAGTVIIVKSTVSNKILKVWPDAAATINAISSNGALSLASGPTPAIFIAASSTQWYTIPLLPS